ncbi:WD40 repeat-like protein [Linnemannia elongata AG-77]|uniref:WD40 repeat-like protein n=1 Tax=Linnemannia elongata AG-77 TaxID=1314771 RepID=A0A197JDG1_9FUNG|nr:WD40 repeat-like protein [Linnemannia elongata AG-77]
MPILKLPFFLAAKDRKQDWSYNSSAPAVNPSPVLGPLRKREYQTRQQQIRQGTPRRIGCPTRSQDEFPIYEHRNISPISPESNSATRPASRTSSRPKGSGSTSRATPLSNNPTHPLSSSSPPSSMTSSFYFPSPKAYNNSPEIGSPDSDMDWTASPTSSSGRGSTASSMSSFSLSSGSYSKGFMMMSYAMGYGGSSIPNASTLPSLTNSHLSVAQIGGAGRRMSTPSISTSKSRRDSTEVAPTLPSSSASSCRSSSMAPRPTSALSTSRTWVASMPSSSSMISADEENGYYNVEQSSPVSPQLYGHVQTNKMTEYVSSRVPTIITEREYDVEGYDKVFAVTWLNSEEVLMGTKCNKLIVLNTRTNKRVHLGRTEECLEENSTSVLSRLGDMAAEREGGLFSGSLSKRPVKSGGSPRSSGNGGITSSLERGLRFLNSGRRSSTPSFTTITSNQQGANRVMTVFPPSPNFNANVNPTMPAAAVPTTNQETAVNYTSTNGTTTANTNTNTDPFLSGLMHGIAAASTSAGVRSLSINPSRTLLAIGAGEPFQVTIYSIPEYEPVGIMYGHADLVFSLTWVTDTVLVSGSRDGSMRVWSMDSPVMATLPSVNVPIEVRFPVLSREEEATKVRDLSLNKGTGQLMTLTTEGYVKLWDRESYIQISKLKLLRSTETVCLTSNADANLFAVGSQSHITIIDPRTSGLVHETESCDEGWGVRALDFKSHIITTGGGFGRLGYYDLRAQRYLDGFDNGPSNRRYQDIGAGWLNRDTTYAGSISGITIRNAVYTMQYDSTGTRLFAAGGPLQLGLCGSYAGLWS